MCKKPGCYLSPKAACRGLNAVVLVESLNQFDHCTIEQAEAGEAGLRTQIREIAPIC